MSVSHTLIIFGASGDLTRRKLIPALFALHRKQRLPGLRIVGVSRSPLSDAEWRNGLRDFTADLQPNGIDVADWKAFAAQLHYRSADVGSVEGMRALAGQIDALEESTSAARLYYLSTTPKLYESAVANLGAAGLADEADAPRRIVFEKPFGTDLESAQRLNHAIHQVFREDQVYRIDHYLGKETVQNAMVLRFANTVFEPIWNRNFVDHVQITVAEEVAVGSRGGYYDGVGILRDMFQNHLLQLMTITAMEVPAKFEPNLVRDEKVKVLQAVRPLTGGDFANDTCRGQYQGYRDEEGIPSDSQTATFAVLKLLIDNWRWKDVPFYLRSGKAMSCRTTQIVIQFREPPHLLFDARPSAVLANRLVMQIQPAEGIQLHFQSKVPDAGMQTRSSHLDFRFRGSADEALSDAYQRLLLDALAGDASLFARSDEVELAWRIIDPIVAAWQSPAAPPMSFYPSGGWGPEESTDWMRRQSREWFDVCPVLK